MAGEGQTPAGWYPDPEGGAGQRYWDGTQWTDQRQDTPPQQQLPPPQAGQPVIQATNAWVVGAPPEKKKSKARGCVTAIAVVVGLFIVIGVIAAIAGGGDDDTTGSTKSENSSGTKKELDEVKITACEAPDAIGAVYVKGTAENTSSKRSDYFIDVTVIAPDGTQIGTGSTIAQNVDPKQKALWSAITDTNRDDWKAGTVCKVIKVDRNASL